MIASKETNSVYFSELLSSDKRFTQTCNALTELLEKHSVKYSFLKATKDIWCRDYMPIQIDKEKFVQFRYEPSYLKDDLELQSDPKEVCKANNIKPQFSKINLDGGNVVNWSDRAIITDRVFDENPEYLSKNKLIAEIEKLLEVEIIVIPQIKSDMTGHADGMVRFVDRNTLLGNNREQEYKYWKNGINKILKEKGIEYIDIPFLDHKEKNYPDHAIGCYVNYLEVENLIVIPIFETEKNKDQEVYDKFKEIFPNRKIETINYNEIGFFGGLLNCTTWTIKD
ncbi:agmatine deiminase family protein [Geofilum rubicundum]|uniref:Peptidylarginine deiminase family protein n=1 Tax=Geofilum rubicundum JCM 15548 TaxID=1236989 RepID=A0A0E9LRF5_9BACT|nr:agmatine deiminase family protein [Geofilum rubicundum]GAO27731.1 peptidylarginine deiminase family protein [Geofilum rubicundum JCM 15548]